jgi:hypothetical protein
MMSLRNWTNGNRRACAAAGLLFTLTGCATRWDNPNFSDETAKRDQLKDDNGYCAMVAAGAAPLPDVRPAVSTPQPYTVNGRVTTYTPNVGYSTSTYTGTAYPQTGGFAQGMSSGLQNGMALGAMMAARDQQKEITAACMRRLGWTDRPVPKRKTAATVSQTPTAVTPAPSPTASEQAAKIQAAVDRNPKLRYAQQRDVTAFNQMAAIDAVLRQDPDWKGRPLDDRFTAVVKMYEASHGEIVIPQI